MVKILIYLCRDRLKITNDTQSVNQYLIFGLTKCENQQSITNINCNTTRCGPKEWVGNALSIQQSLSCINLT